MADKYRNFGELAVSEREGTDYRITVRERPGPVVIVVPHGGKIEPGTSGLGMSIAGQDHSLYLFEGLKTQDNWNLHVTSRKFDEPRALKLIRDKRVITVHGCAGDDIFVEVGGKDQQRANRLSTNLREAGFAVRQNGRRDGILAENVCNRGLGGVGVQLELSRGLRDGDQNTQRQFVDAVRAVIIEKRSARQRSAAN